VRLRLTVDDSDYHGNITNLTTGQKIDGSSGLTPGRSWNGYPTTT